MCKTQTLCLLFSMKDKPSPGIFMRNATYPESSKFILSKFRHYVFLQCHLGIVVQTGRMEGCFLGNCAMLCWLLWWQGSPAYTSIGFVCSIALLWVQGWENMFNTNASETWQELSWQWQYRCLISVILFMSSKQTLEWNWNEIVNWNVLAFRSGLAKLIFSNLSSFGNIRIKLIVQNRCQFIDAPRQLTCGLRVI